MKSLFSKLFLILLFGLAMTCFLSPDLHAQSQMKIRLAHALPATMNNPCHLTCLKFAEVVEKESNGRVKIDVIGGGSLGGERAIAEQITLGGIQMAQLGVASGGSHLSDKIPTEELPYAWDSYDQILKAYNAELGINIQAIFLEKGRMVSLGFLPFGMRHFTNNVRPIRTVEDMAGIKVRTAEVPLRVDAFVALKAQVVPIPFPELFTALQQGTVDAQENPLSMIKESRIFEVQKYLSLTGHILSMNHFVINEAFYNKLPDDIKDLLKKSARQMQDYMLEQVVNGDKASLEALKQSMKVNEDVDKKAFRKAMAPVYEKYKKVFGPDIWAALEKYSSINAQ